MTRIFHQNLQDYRGNPAKTDALAELYRHIGTFRRDVIVVGFTEVLASNEQVRNNLSALARSMDGALTELVVIDVGTTVGGDWPGRQEYIGIAWDPQWVHMDYAGVVVRHAVTREWWPHFLTPDRIQEQ
ncbi:MAG TPA: hypothetical protein VF188_17125 [Longimicrobiales bacterium]